MLAAYNRTVERALGQLRRRDGLRQIAIVIGAIASYEAARGAMQTNWAQAVTNAHHVMRLEQLSGLAWEQWLQAAFLGVPGIVKAMNIFYFVGHFVLTGIFFVWLYHRSRAGFRVFRNGFLLATLVSVVIHWRFPTAPPRLADVDLIDTLRLFSNIDIGSPHSTALSNPVAAVPSLHAGFAFGVGLGLVHYGRSLFTRALGIVYPIAAVLTIIVTGNHFVLDAVAGMVVVCAGLYGARRLARRKSAREGTLLYSAPATRGGAVR